LAHFQVIGSGQNEFGNSQRFWFGEGFRSRIDFAAHILTGSFAVPFVVEIAVGIGARAEGAQVLGSRLPPHAIRSVGVLVTCLLTHSKQLLLILND